MKTGEWSYMSVKLTLYCTSLNQQALDRIQNVICTGREEAKIDLKQDLDLGKETCKAELAKDIAAIANTPGFDNGYIIIGVLDNKQRNNDDPADYIIGFRCADVDAFWGQINQALDKFLYPLPAVACHELNSNLGNPLLAIEIQRSYHRPHALKRTSGEIESNQIWIRRGPFSFKASTEELREMITGSQQWIIINFSTHPLTDRHKEQIRRLGFGSVKQFIEVPVQLDNNRVFNEQVNEIVKSVNLTLHQWQTEPILLSLPGFSPAAGLILAQLHGMMGHFPSIMRMKPAGGGFEVGEIINLHEVREDARKFRSSFC